ncbi:hypothetical protein KUTeg_011915 [Tegillarca granosa]|uniref:Uncharacterized protein n=1 Tax=Tegillarca granosa TaxID=220873 RepID=A0ABQ9F381_TEGGR|nr:hypothetical protein KUTeg_011915 [Tegillarca granosa]
MADRFVERLKEEYPNGNLKLENELRRLKDALGILSNETRKEHLHENMEIDQTEADPFSECEEEMLCEVAAKTEAEYFKTQSGFKCLISLKVYKSKKQQHRHIKTHCLSYTCSSCKKTYAKSVH